MMKTDRFVLAENCRYGRFLVPPTDEYVGKALLTYGEYSQIELDALLQLVTEQTRVIVAGANLGSIVVPIAQKAAEVVAFEPQRWVYQLLCANVVLNNLLNVRAYWGGLGSRLGTVSMPIFDPDQPNNFGAIELEAVQEMGGDLVPIYTLDMFPENDIDCGLLIIDVEGMEGDVLLGATKLVARCRPIIAFEADRALKRKGVFDLLRKANYELFWHRTPLFNTQNFAGKIENIWGGDSGTAVVVAENVIATPRERAIKLHGFPPVLEI